MNAKRLVYLPFTDQNYIFINIFSINSSTKLRANIYSQNRTWRTSGPENV